MFLRSFKSQIIKTKKADGKKCIRAYWEDNTERKQRISMKNGWKIWKGSTFQLIERDLYKTTCMIILPHGCRKCFVIRTINIILKCSYVPKVLFDRRFCLRSYIPKILNTNPRNVLAVNSSKQRFKHAESTTRFRTCTKVVLFSILSRKITILWIKICLEIFLSRFCLVIVFGKKTISW